MEGLELLCFQMISYNGTARSCYVEAVAKAKQGRYDEAEQLMSEGDKNFTEGHKVHTQVIQSEARGKLENIHLLLIHAEDQMISAETIQIISHEFIELYQSLSKAAGKERP
ncbi:MAG: PTS lactose/cellobiose transporter subunit IIA [Sporolactobacillus sp.]|jgi:PTS system cellobiose-specific IIA component|nr:PTS lactose/cellobiose transporter subunit IIA [Sporolactobacillus sp.]